MNGRDIKSLQSISKTNLASCVNHNTEEKTMKQTEFEDCKKSYR